ncbi:MAG: nucleotidyl transferase AbiEii/AbiGii toxin family protein, partial [Endomicrobiales bacterium]
MKEITNLPASVRGRLQNKAKETGRPFAEVLQFYGMERFLYRLSHSRYAENFILKGALMFTVWQVPQRRTTLDIDFLARCDNQIANIKKTIRDVCVESVPSDGLIFDPQTIRAESIREDADYGGVRIKLIGFLERSRIPMQIDIGFGEIVYPKPTVIDYPVILDLPGPHLNGYPIESVVSEKFEAMVKLGVFNTRMKDFYDIWLMIRQFNFKGYDLSEALKGTFNHRKTSFPEHKPLFEQVFYEEKSDRQVLWKTFINNSEFNHVPEKLSIIVREIEGFLIRPLEIIKENQEFRE